MICKLCHLEKEPKPNTHYLTDSIIKTALNVDGKSERNTGLIFEIDTRKSYVDFKYQQVSGDKVEEVLGRQATDEEIEAAAKRTDNAVSDSFCYNCEDKFSAIETEFSRRLIKRFRDADFTGVDELVFNQEDSKLLRLFFLMQFWRVSVCEYSFILPEDVSEFIREKLLNFDLEGLEEIPLAITYLETKPLESDEGDLYKTENMVKAQRGSNPYLIFMNDFIIQMYDPRHYKIGIFKDANDSKFLNQKLAEFTVKIYPDAKRRKMLGQLAAATSYSVLANSKMEFYKRYVEEFASLPSDNDIHRYGMELTTSGTHSLVKEKVDKFNNTYFEMLARVKNKQKFYRR